MATATTTYRIPINLKGAVKPDPVKVRTQLDILQTEWNELGPAGFAEAYCWILRKNPEPGEKDLLAGKSHWWNKRLIPFRHNRIQLNLDEEIFHWDVINKRWKDAKLENGKIIPPRSVKRNIMLKPRQAGYTTYFLIMRLLIPTILEPGTTSLLISQNSTYAAMHFAMVKRALRYFGARKPLEIRDPKANEWATELHNNILHQAYSNRHEVIFDQLDSRIICASAEVEEVGQGVTLQHVQCTEAARWEGNPEETMANMKEAISSEGTLDIESTANGQGGYFFEECQRAMDPKNKLSEFKFHFHEWWWHDEYTRNPRKYRVSESTLTEEEKTIIKKANLSLRQIAFRREKKIALRHNFDEKYPEDPQTCFLISGNTYFDRDILRARYLELRPNDSMLWYKPEAKLQKLQIFERRIKGRNYIIGADPAAGITKSGDSDFSAAVVIDQMTGKEMASYRTRIPPDDFAFDLAELGRAYNDAHIVVERMGDGLVVMKTLEVQCQYMNIYKHKDLAKYDRKKLLELPGFPTTMKTRPLGLGWLKSFLNKFPELIFDVRFLEEAFTFVFNKETRKPEAAAGTHDDTVMCRALAYYARMVRLGFYDPITGYSASYEEQEDEDVAADYADLDEDDVAP